MKHSLSWKHLVYFMLFLFICFISMSMHEFINRMDYILQYPVRVSQETRAMKTRAQEMQNFLLGILAMPGVSYSELEKIFARQDAAQDTSMDKTSQLFRGDPAHLEKARQTFLKMREARHKTMFLQMKNNYDPNDAIALYGKMVAPEVKNLYESLNELSFCADNLMAKAQTETRKAAQINIIITIVFGGMIIAAFIYLDVVEKNRNREIQSRDMLFNQLSQNVDEVFFIVRDASMIDYVSSSSKRLIGIDAVDIMKNPRRLYEFLPEGDGKWLYGILHATTPIKGIVERDIVIEGGNRIFKLSVHPVSPGGLENVRCIVVLHDQTKEYQHQKDLHDALENAHAASAAKSSFLSHMSHEIRTPMNAIIGMTTIALGKIDDKERVEDCLGKIAESSRHLLGLINDVLDMSKIENGKLVINHESFSLAHSIQNINDLIRPQAQARGINFEIFQTTEYEHLMGDSLRLNQVLLNILSNALKFTPENGVIAMRIQQVKKWHNSVTLRFSISDTGIGMSEEFLKRIFKPFEQESANTSCRYGGTGLGMSITYNLVSLMGGSIFVNSAEGKGTTFKVELPFDVSMSENNNMDSLPPMKILVVDDDHGTCEHASMLLERMGMDVHWVLSGKEAIQAVSEAHESGEGFEVCFIDWKMPDMDGAETARRIRQVIGDDILIIIISAYDWSSIEHSARANGVNDFIAKPFFASSLYDALLSSTRRLGVSKRDSGTEKQKKYDFSGKRVLLVEDNEFNREIAQEFLAMVNAAVEEAVNGQDAVEKFKASEHGYFDIILMDVQMPVMDGYEATRKIRALNHPDAASIPILAMTANAFNEDVANAVAAGMNSHIAKPIDINELYKIMDKYMAQAGNKA